MPKKALKIHLIPLGGASYGASQNAFAFLKIYLLIKHLKILQLVFCFVNLEKLSALGTSYGALQNAFVFWK